MKKHFSLWMAMMLMSLSFALQSRFGAIFFILAKIMRFSFFLLFLILLGSKTKVIGDYTIWQMILFFATFNLVDTLAQFFFREVYRFRNLIIRGYFDYILLMPKSPLFRSLFGGSDILDLPLLFISVIFLFITSSHIGSLNPLQILLYISLVANALLIATSFHIFVLALCVITTEIDSALFLYRDITQMGRIPVDIYHEPLRGFVTFVVPVGIMMTFPAKVLMGLLSPGGIVVSFSIGFIFFITSIAFWQLSLKRYASASS